MASENSLNEKSLVINEIKDAIKNSEAVVLFKYHGLNVADISRIRKDLMASNSEVKIYKNTLTKRALDELKINLDEFLEGPNAIMFGKSILEPIKVLDNVAKTNKALEMRAGIINGEVVSLEVIKEYAAIPSREGLLTMFAVGLTQYVREFAIGLDLYAKKLEEEK